METRRIRDLQSCFKDTSNCDLNSVVYKFNNIIPSDTAKDLLYGITTIYPGDVNGEFYMTKGHFHDKKTSEVYLGLDGTGIVVMQNRDGSSYTEELSPGKVVYVNAETAHRVVNTGAEDLRFFCVCRADSGHDYSAEFNDRFFRR